MYYKHRKNHSTYTREIGDASGNGSGQQTAGKRARAANALTLFAFFLISLFFWEIFLFRQIHGSFRDFSVWILAFIPAEAAFLTFLTGWSSNSIIGKLFSTVLLTAVWFFYVAQLVYFRIFGSMFSVSMIGMAGEAVDDFGWALKATIRDSVGVILLSLIPLALYIVFVSVSRSVLRYGALLHIAALLLVPLFWFSAAAALPLSGTQDYSAYAAYHSTLIDTDTSSSKLGVLSNSLIEAYSIFAGTRELPQDSEPDAIGPDTEDLEIVEEPAVTVDRSPNILEEIDFASLAENAPTTRIRELCEYFQTVPPTGKNEYTGLFKDYNLIYICAESFSALTLDENVTPTLCRLAGNGIILDNYYNSFKNTTTNGEYAFLTGLWPDVSRNAKFGTTVGSFAKSATHYMPYGLGTIFSEQLGVTGRAYHNYKGSYYARNRTLPNLGFDCKFMGSGMTFTSSWPSSDLEMMEQSVDDYIYDDRFCTYYITFSGHGPYSSDNVMYNRNIRTVRELAGDRQLSGTAIGYLACNYELEKAMAYLLERLEEAGKLDNTLIVLTGDHYPYYLYDKDRDALAGHKVDTDFEMYKSSCIMWTNSLDEPIHSDVPCCNVDILPTVLNLLGLRYDSRMIAGRDIFASTPHFAALYNKNFITNEVMYNSGNGKAGWFSHEDDTDEFKQNYLSYYTAQVKNRYSMSLRIEETDFYRYVWDNTQFNDPQPDPAQEDPSPDETSPSSDDQEE